MKYVYQKGKTVRKPKMSLVSCVNTKGYTRVAVVVSKKVEKLAVNRNRIRRRVYEAIRLEFDDVPKKRDYIFVVYSKEIATLPFEELKKLVSGLVEEMCYNGSNG